MNSTWDAYKKKIPVSEEIYLELFGEPKSHREWAEGFNVRERIIRILQKHE